MQVMSPTSSSPVLGFLTSSIAERIWLPAIMPRGGYPFESCASWMGSLYVHMSRRSVLSVALPAFCLSLSFPFPVAQVNTGWPVGAGAVPCLYVGLGPGFEGN